MCIHLIRLGQDGLVWMKKKITARQRYLLLAGASACSGSPCSPGSYGSVGKGVLHAPFNQDIMDLLMHMRVCLHEHELVSMSAWPYPPTLQI